MIDQQVSHVDVNISRALLKRLHQEARATGVPVEWLIASLLADSMEAAENEAEAMPMA